MAAFIASLSSSGSGSADCIHLQQAVLVFNSQGSLPNAISVNFALASPSPTQKVLSGMIEFCQLDGFSFTCLQSSSPVGGTTSFFFLAISGPSISWGLHLESNEYRMAIKWWLGLETSGQSMCPFCPDTTLDPLGHHAVTCRHGGDVVIRHNHLRDEIFDLCRRAHLSASVDRGHGLT